MKILVSLILVLSLTSFVFGDENQTAYYGNVQKILLGSASMVSGSGLLLNQNGGSNGTSCGLTLTVPQTIDNNVTVLITTNIVNGHSNGALMVTLYDASGNGSNYNMNLNDMYNNASVYKHTFSDNYRNGFLIYMTGEDSNTQVYVTSIQYIINGVSYFVDLTQ